MSFTHFHACKSSKSLWSSLSSPLLWNQKGHSVQVETQVSFTRLQNRCALCFIRNALPKEYMLKMHSFNHICSAAFNPISPVASKGRRAIPTNLRKLAVCVVPTCGSVAVKTGYQTIPINRRFGDSHGVQSLFRSRRTCCASRKIVMRDSV